MKLLNEQTVEVDEDVLCITDAAGPIGLAGIMGGDSTKAGPTPGTSSSNPRSSSPTPSPAARAATTSRATPRTASSAASTSTTTSPGIERATELILEICGGEPGPTVDTVARLPERKPVRMRSARAQKVIGITVPADEIGDIFARLGLAATRSRRGADGFSVTPPSYRFDIEIEEDLIEEIARIHGYERIPAQPPRVPARMREQPETVRSLHDLRAQHRRARLPGSRQLQLRRRGLGARFRAATRDPVRLLNPIASQLAVMRSTLVGSLIANVRYNLNRKQARVRVFELGRVFRARRGACRTARSRWRASASRSHVGAIAYGPARRSSGACRRRGRSISTT